MSDSLTPWLAKAVEKYRAQHKLDLSASCRGQLVQLTEFNNYRYKDKPDYASQDVWAYVHDKQWKALVKFEAAAINAFEGAGQSFTTYKGALIQIKSFHFEISTEYIDSTTARAQTATRSMSLQQADDKVPRLVLSISDFEYYSSKGERDFKSNCPAFDRLVREWMKDIQKSKTTTDEATSITMVRSSSTNDLAIPIKAADARDLLRAAEEPSKAASPAIIRSASTSDLLAGQAKSSPKRSSQSTSKQPVNRRRGGAAYSFEDLNLPSSAPRRRRQILNLNNVGILPMPKQNITAAVHVNKSNIAEIEALVALLDDAPPNDEPPTSPLKQIIEPQAPLPVAEEPSSCAARTSSPPPSTSMMSETYDEADETVMQGQTTRKPARMTLDELDAETQRLRDRYEHRPSADVTLSQGNHGADADIDQVETQVLHYEREHAEQAQQADSMAARTVDAERAGLSHNLPRILSIHDSAASEAFAGTVQVHIQAASSGSEQLDQSRLPTLAPAQSVDLLANGGQSARQNGSKGDEVTARHSQNPGPAEGAGSGEFVTRSRKLSMTTVFAGTMDQGMWHRDADVAKQRLEQEKKQGCVDQVTRLLDWQNGLAPSNPQEKSDLPDVSAEQVMPTGGADPSHQPASTLPQSPRALSQAGGSSEVSHHSTDDRLDHVPARLSLAQPPSKRFKDKPSVLPRFTLSQDNATSSALLEVVTVLNTPVVLDEQSLNSSAAQDLPTDDAVVVSPLSSVPLEHPQMASEPADLCASGLSMAQVAARLTETESFPALAPSELEDIQSEDDGFQFVVFKPGQPAVLPVVKQESSPARPISERVAPPNHGATGPVKDSASSQSQTTFTLSCTQGELSRWADIEEEDSYEPPIIAVDGVIASSTGESLDNRIRNFVRDNVTDLRSPTRQRIPSPPRQLIPSDASTARPSASAATQRKAGDVSTSMAHDVVRTLANDTVHPSTAYIPSVLTVSTTTKTSNKRKYFDADPNTSDLQPKKRQKVKILPKPLDPDTHAQVRALRRKIELELVILNISLTDAIDLWYCCSGDFDLARKVVRLKTYSTDASQANDDSKYAAAQETRRRCWNFIDDQVVESDAGPIRNAKIAAIEQRRGPGSANARLRFLREDPMAKGFQRKPRYPGH